MSRSQTKGFTFLLSLAVPTGHHAAAGLVSSGVEGLDYQVPPGYAEHRGADMTLFVPITPNGSTPCLYGIAKARPGTGDLDRDAESALIEVVVPGWPRIDDGHLGMRGVSAAGWRYSWYRAAFRGVVNGTPQAVNAMAMVLPAGSGLVHVAFGMGDISRCLLDDASFEHLFHGLSPKGWTSDGGKALKAAMVGGWRYTAGAGLQQFYFGPDGRYDRDLGTRAQVGVLERTASSATGGRYSLDGSLLTLTPDQRPGNPDRYRARPYEERYQGKWRRSLALLASGESRVIQYFRIEESSR